VALATGSTDEEEEEEECDHEGLIMHSLQPTRGCSTVKKKLFLNHESYT